MLLAGLVLAGGLLAPATGAEERQTFTQATMSSWPLQVLDLVVVPPAHGQLVNGNGVLGGGGAGELTPFGNTYLPAIRRAVDGWNAAIAAFGPPALQPARVALHVVGPGFPLAALGGAEIAAIPLETMGNIGGVSGGRVGDLPCEVTYSMSFVASFTAEDMASIFGHELGHCLGLDHPLDNQPAHDLMDGTYDHVVGTAGTEAHCPSNLNVLGLEVAFGLRAGPATMDAAAYRLAVC